MAQTVDWNPVHLYATLEAAYQHQGLALRAHPAALPAVQAGRARPLQNDPSQLLLMTHPDGIQLDDSIQRIFKNQHEHDPSDMDTARELAGNNGALPIGLFYRNESADRYDEYTTLGIATPRDEKIAAVKAELSHYQI